jgi:DNA-binding FrmR family transcriptional regulator
VDGAHEAHARKEALSVDKKVKKKQDVLRQRLQKLQQQLSGARKQMDDPQEVRRLEQDVAAAENELQKLK